MRLGLLIIVLAVWSTAQEKPVSTPHEFNGTYEHLRPQQKKLIDEWYAEYNKMTGDNEPPTDYDLLSLSTRTTFEAVTHALLTTKLTDKSGKPLGTALDLVGAIETINGKVPRARGDLQFRMYVVLKPEALQKLKESSEFFRDHDNTVYHHGYPLNYRQDGGTPSIQFSMAKDGKHADIDVDYRSAKFPDALFNGHLTAANSDVRAGGNTQRHLNRWDGLTDWWRNLFGLADASEESPAATAANSGEVPPIPRQGAGKLEDAVQDFLTSWLVEQRPELAAAYLSPRSFACLEEYGPQAGKEVNAGVAPYLAARDMAATNKLIGKPATLPAAVNPSAIAEAGVKPMNQRYAAIFNLYQVTDGIAADYECNPERAFEDYDKSRQAGTKRKYGRYFASAFQLKPAQGKGDAITMLWVREGKFWKIVSWDVEPEDAKPSAVPDTRNRAPTTVATESHIKGDADFVQASNRFLHSWLIADNFEAAAQYFSPKVSACVKDYLSPGEQAPQTSDQYAAYLRKALTTVAKDVGPVQHLRDAVEPVDPEHDDLKLVGHPAEDAYTAVAVPDSLVEAFSCEEPSAQHPYPEPSANSHGPTYGNYYVTMFAMRTPGDHPAALTFLWSKEGGQWKIVAYELAAP